MARKLRIMHGPSEVAGQNAYAVQGLKAIGEDARCVIFYRHPFDYPYDQCLNIDKSRRALFPYYALKLGAFMVSALFRYNTFHFHFGHSILNTRELGVYDLFRKQCFFEFHGSDLRDYRRFCEKTGMPYDPAEESGPKLPRRNERICKKARGIIVHDDELIPYLPQGCRNVYVVPLRVDIGKFSPVYPKASNERVRIVHAPSKRAIKGTQYVLEAFDRLKQKYANIELVLVEGKTQQEAFEIYKTADIIVDQLFVGTYGVFAIESMALGKPVITRISDEMRQRLPESLPIVSADIHTVDQALETLINDPALRREKGLQGRRYAENYHDYRAIAHVLKGIYDGTEPPRAGRDAFRRVRDIKEGSLEQAHD